MVMTIFGLFCFWPLLPNLNTVAISQSQHAKTEQKRMELMTVKDVVERLGVSKTTLYDMIKNGSFPEGGKIGKQRRWSKDTVEKWIAEAVGA